MNPKKYLLFIMLPALFLACDGVEPEVTAVDGLASIGYRPVYGPAESSTITWSAPLPVKNPGKIYVFGKYLLVNEIKKGIHVLDNTNPQAPSPVGFVNILGNTDMAIKDGVLYADHMDNLVALTFQDFTSVEEKGRLELSQWNLGVPPPAGFKFECVDPSKGLVIDWKRTDSQNLKCYALR